MYDATTNYSDKASTSDAVSRSSLTAESEFTLKSKSGIAKRLYKKLNSDALQRTSESESGISSLEAEEKIGPNTLPYDCSLSPSGSRPLTGANYDTRSPTRSSAQSALTPFDVNCDSPRLARARTIERYRPLARVSAGGNRNVQPIRANHQLNQSLHLETQEEAFKDTFAREVAIETQSFGQPSSSGSAYDEDEIRLAPPRTGSRAFEANEFAALIGNEPSFESQLTVINENGRSQSMSSLPVAALKSISIEDARKNHKKRRRPSLIGKHRDAENENELLHYFPDKKVTIFVGTFNIAGKKAADYDLSEWLLSQSLNALPDVYAIGIQEGPTGTDFNTWEIALQSVIGPSHVLYHSVWLGVQHLSIFVRRELVWYFSMPDHAVFSTRLVSQIKTKGAVGIMFYLFGTSFLFISCHLTALESEERYLQRRRDLDQILTNLKFARIQRKNPKDCSEDFDVAFFFGDMNFRLRCEVSDVMSAIKNGEDFDDTLLVWDELTMILQEDKPVMNGFNESPVKFQPTYKYQFNKQSYDLRRKPAYCDRILHKFNTITSLLDCITYNHVPHVEFSDHRPVFAVFKASLLPIQKTIVSSAGKFNRDIYMRGIHKIKKPNSKICSMM